MGNKNYGFIKPEYLKPELSTKLYHSTHRYLARFYSENIFEEACAELQMPKGYLLEDDNWVSVDFGAQFAQLIREKTGDPEVYRRIGHFFFSPENLSPFEYSLLKSLSPHLAVKMAESFYRKRNLACEFNFKKIGMGKYFFELSSKKPLYYDMALNTLGIIEAFQKLYNLDLWSTSIDVDDQNKLHKINIHLQFAAINFYIKRISLVASLLLSGFALGWFFVKTESFLEFTLLPIVSSIAYLLGFGLYRVAKTQKVFRKSAEDYQNKMREKNQNLYEKSQLLERRYQEASLLKKLSSELIACTDPHHVIETCLQSIKNNFKYQRAAVFLISHERQKLYLANSIGFESLPIQANQIEFQFPNPDKKEGFVATVLENGETSLILDVETYKTILKPHNKQLLELLRVGSLIISPIQSDKKKFGAFVLIRDHEEQLLDNQDKFLVENITSQLSLYFESAWNFDQEVKLRSIFQKYVPKVVLDQLNDQLHTSNGSLSPKKMDICSVFMDLRGFTKACDGASPERAFALINHFAEFATKHLAAHGAIIDNIIGDEIVCFFPKDSNNPNNHILRALNAAFDIKSNFADFNNLLKSNGFPSLRLGIGMHCGEASVGSVGSDAKMNYTALGTTVNVASRLQALSKKFDKEEVAIIASHTSVTSLLKDADIEIPVESEVLRGTAEATQFVKLDSEEIEKILAHHLLVTRQKVA